MLDGDDVYSVLASDKNISLENYKSIIKKFSFGTYTGTVRKLDELER